MFKNILVGCLVVLVPAFIGFAVYRAFTTIKSKYIYVARGAECQEFDREYNTLKKCTSGEALGEFEIINPISIVKIRVENE